MDRRNTRTPLAHAAGLGPCRTGVEDWWAQRVSAIALIPLTLWFAASIIAHIRSDHAAFVNWLKSPASAILMILLLIALFHHTALGLKVVIEDYTRAGAKFATLILMRLSCFAVAVVGIIATLRIVFRG